MNEAYLFLCSSLQVLPPSPYRSRLSRRPITFCSPTHGSMGPSPAWRQHTWFRALDKGDMECFWSDRARHAGETTSLHLTTKEKQRCISQCLIKREKTEDSFTLTVQSTSWSALPKHLVIWMNTFSEPTWFFFSPSYVKLVFGQVISQQQW